MSAGVLVLGGSGEGRTVAAALAARGVPVVSSLAGRVAEPLLPAGEVRIGGFGGPDGLAAWLREHPVAAVVDATHPFAVRISASARTACTRAGVPLVVVRRPAWTPGPGDDWRPVPTLEDAAALLPGVGARAFLTTGRRSLGPFLARAPAAGKGHVVRVVDPPDPPLPPGWAVVVDRGPYTVAGEAALMAGHDVDVVVTKNSGGSAAAAKLTAARERGIPVVVVERPPTPPDVPGVVTVATVAEALSRLASLPGTGAG